MRSVSEYLLRTFVVLLIITVVRMSIGFIMWSAFHRDYVLHFFDRELCGCGLFSMCIVVYLEWRGCHVDWFLDVLFGMWIFLSNLSEGL